MSDDTNEIQVAAEHFLHALDNLDWERFVACWSSDPSAFYPDDETRVDGRAAVLTRFRTMFDQIPLRASGPPYLHLNPRNLRINRYGDAGLVTFMLLDKPGPHRSGPCSLSGRRERGSSLTSTPPTGYSCELPARWHSRQPLLHRGSLLLKSSDTMSARVSRMEV